MADMRMYYHENITERLFSECITKDDIRIFRDKTKIGQVFLVKTIKSCEIESSQPKYLVEQKGVVIAKYARFARLKLDNGPIEDVLWADLIKMDRKKSASRKEKQ